MNDSPRERMVETAARLFQQEGYRATSWRKLVNESGAPWGSAHHYFPGGKAQLGVAAVERAAGEVVGLIAHAFGEGRGPADGVRKLFAVSGALLARSGFRAGCPVTTVALETAPDTPAVAEACRAAFQLWRDALASALEAAGLETQQARALAPAILASFEGALVMARLDRSLEPMDAAADAMASLLKSMAA